MAAVVGPPNAWVWILRRAGAENRARALQHHEPFIRLRQHHDPTQLCHSKPYRKASFANALPRSHTTAMHSVQFVQKKVHLGPSGYLQLYM